MVEEKPGIRGFSGLQERFMKCLGFKWQTKCSDESDSWTFIFVETFDKHWDVDVDS